MQSRGFGGKGIEEFGSPFWKYPPGFMISSVIFCIPASSITFSRVAKTGQWSEPWLGLDACAYIKNTKRRKRLTISPSWILASENQPFMPEEHNI